MGNSIHKGINKFKLNTMTADSEIGEATECPICGTYFSEHTTYYVVFYIVFQ